MATLAKNGKIFYSEKTLHVWQFLAIFGIVTPSDVIQTPQQHQQVADGAPTLSME